MIRVCSLILVHSLLAIYLLVFDAVKKHMGERRGGRISELMVHGFLPRTSTKKTYQLAPSGLEFSRIVIAQTTSM
jgi:hypothetical protein